MIPTVAAVSVLLSESQNHTATNSMLTQRSSLVNYWSVRSILGEAVQGQTGPWKLGVDTQIRSHKRKSSGGRLRLSRLPLRTQSGGVERALSTESHFWPYKRLCARFGPSVVLTPEMIVVEHGFHAAAVWVSWRTLERRAVRMAVVAMRPALVRW